MNAAEKLAGEIERVTMVREHYRLREAIPGANMQPAIMLMTAAIEKAKAAVGSGEAVDVVAALKDLEGFSG